MGHLTTCPFCDGSVSDEAAACPHCGRRLWGARPPRQAAAYTPAIPVSRPAPAKQTYSPVPMIIYVLLGLGFLYFIPPVLGVALAYVNRGEARGTWLESHYQWQIHTFWAGLVYAIAVAVVGFVVVMGTQSMGSLVLMGAAAVGVFVWYAWRVIRGALVLHKEQEIG
ncbi:DUF4870 family protein [Longimicrobium terrae]|uniref:Putative membrane protein n=1 Tax=Longimicrobium terrae TaxID=1639882 RepID=A0A841H136_9BACT|nr:hypothetical protein [Longimicrobium terrae]MBB4637268.1 putative membrane protein [Longimicrobium terrae]MBB6071666.1 putative membrane protein [Longimicrobium terrae]NNC28427.1 hypothetical protein [Longimicrobium terrae]